MQESQRWSLVSLNKGPVLQKVFPSHDVIMIAGSDWPKFAVEAAKQWAEAYQVYLEASVPLLIMTYEEIHDAAQLRTQLLLISNFLHVAISASQFECILEKFDAFEATPRPLKKGFQPFELLPTETRLELEQMEKNIAKQIQEMREKYRPKV